MDVKKMGRFLKTLRKEKSLTQEQLAEILYVSGRTVSRWETGSRFKSTPFKDLLISVVCSCAFTAALVLCYIRLGANAAQTTHIAILFFAGSAILGFSVLRILAYCNQKRGEKIK